MQRPSLRRSYFIEKTKGRLSLVGKGGASILKFFPAIEIVVTSLQTLNLGLNQLGDAGVTVLAAGLHYVPALKKLVLEWNQLGPAGLTALALELHHLPELQKLELRVNKIGAAGVRALESATNANVHYK